MMASTAFIRSSESTTPTTSSTIGHLRSRQARSGDARRGETWDLRHMSRLRAQFSRREPWALRLLRTLLEDRKRAAASPSFTRRERLTA